MGAFQSGSRGCSASDLVAFELRKCKRRRKSVHKPEFFFAFLVGLESLILRAIILRQWALRMSV